MNEQIITNDELDIINDFIEKNINLFVENGISPNRKLLSLNRKCNPLNLFSLIKNRILVKENILNDYIDDSTYGDYIGYITEGGKIHKHKDPTINGYDHVRFNLFISVPEKGGFPIYNGVTIPVKVGDYVRCNSSKECHECEMIEGKTPRIVISYGIYLKEKKIKFDYK